MNNRSDLEQMLSILTYADKVLSGPIVNGETNTQSLIIDTENTSIEMVFDLTTGQFKYINL